MTHSSTRNENYLGYLVIEMILVMVLTSGAAMLMLLFGLGKMGSRSDFSMLDYLLTNPIVFGLICVSVGLVAVGFLLKYRNRKYVVGYLFDDGEACLVVEHRTLWSKTSEQVSLPFSQLNVTDFTEKKFLFNQAYEGKRLSLQDQNLKLDFVTSNFIWEEQRNDRIHFLEELERITETAK